MVLQLFAKKPATVAELVAAKKYDDAVALVKQQLRSKPGDTVLRMQAAEVLILAGKFEAAERILSALADEFATMGFAAKAIAVLKKIQKIDPGRKDIEVKLAELIMSGTDPAASRMALSPEQLPSAEDIDIGDLAAGMSESAPEIAVSPAASEERAEAPVAEELPAISEPPELAQPPAPEPLFVMQENEPETLEDLVVVVEETASDQPRLVSPLFGDFSKDELVEVMRGMKLLTFEAGDIIVTQGEKGDSLFVLTTGVVKAFVRTDQGGNTQVRQMGEGDFFGEISVLSGKPRTATITAATDCELLVLDRETLDELATRRPNIRKVLQQFADQRLGTSVPGAADASDMEGSDTALRAGLIRTSSRPVASPVPEPEDDPGDVTIDNLRQLAVEYTRQEKWPDAVSAWRRYNAIRPSDTEAMNVLGILFGRLGRWKDAAHTFTQSARVKADDPSVFFNLGHAYRQMEMLPHAVAAFKQAIKLKPDYEKAKQALESTLERVRAARG